MKGEKNKFLVKSLAPPFQRWIIEKIEKLL
jgi:hypothetical protein